MNHNLFLTWVGLSADTCDKLYAGLFTDRMRSMNAPVGSKETKIWTDTGITHRVDIVRVKDTPCTYDMTYTVSRDITSDVLDQPEWWEFSKEHTPPFMTDMQILSSHIQYGIQQVMRSPSARVSAMDSQQNNQKMPHSVPYLVQEMLQRSGRPTTMVSSFGGGCPPFTNTIPANIVASISPDAATSVLEQLLREQDMYQQNNQSIYGLVEYLPTYAGVSFVMHSWDNESLIDAFNALSMSVRGCTVMRRTIDKIPSLDIDRTDPSVLIPHSANCRNQDPIICGPKSDTPIECGIWLDPTHRYHQNTPFTMGEDTDVPTCTYFREATQYQTSVRVAWTTPLPAELSQAFHPFYRTSRDADRNTSGSSK